MFRHHSDSPLLPPTYYSAASPPPSAAAAAHTLFNGGGGGYNPLYLSPPSSSSSSAHLLRTSSTLSLHSHATDPTPHPPFLSSSPSSSSPCDLLDLRADPSVRRVFSTGDLQGMNAMQASSGDSGSLESAAAGTRVGRYSAEERKEKIERYRSKRNHRNFQKKITYACRKTLADSRPRVRGRFARNGETEAEAEPETVEESSYDAYNYNASCSAHTQSYSTLEQSEYDGGSGGGEWWRQMQAALAMEDEEERCFDEDMWANYLDMFSMNLLS